MITLFFLVVCGESLVAFLLLVKIGPLRELVMKGLEQVKLKRATVFTIAGTVFVILLSDLFSIVKIQNKGSKNSAITPMDQVVWRTNLLEATLLGFSLLLGLLIDRMDHYMRKLVKLRSSAGDSTKEIERLEGEKLQLKEKEEKAAAQVKQLQKDISGLTDSLKKMKMEGAKKDDQIDVYEAYVVALQKQAADLLLEYDRLLEDNHILQNQVFGYHS